MTQLLEQAIAKVKELPPAQQDAIATLILEELEDDALWDKKFGHAFLVVDVDSLEIPFAVNQE